MQTRPGLAQHCRQQPREAVWALPTRQEGTWDPSPSHHVLRLEIVPWVHCAETAFPRTGGVLPSSLSSHALGHWEGTSVEAVGRTTMPALHLQSVCVALRVAALTHPTETAGGKGVVSWNSSEQHSREHRRSKGSASLGTPQESCGNHRPPQSPEYRLSKTPVPYCCIPHFPSCFCLPCLEDPSHTQSSVWEGAGVDGLLVDQQE